MPVVNQLHRAGIPNYSVYDPKASYREAENAEREHQSAQTENKKYNIGYVAGVFDLFHIGHLNLLRRAKEQCNYLIVGVVTDEGVIRHKKSSPKIPYEERIAIVRACRYVDEAVEIPLDQGDTDEAYRRYRFDAQFSGSDYADDPKWMAKRDFLQRHGADLVFFPYTEGVSTTQLKEVVDGKSDEKDSSLEGWGRV
ncbi:MAG: adenylyltransferase/cytidyltransferase family protein [Lachnospiraceae bacterium]|nr:adenylyltransferase/cytidyltransferase family protein [Lachnospiraceae bacterium]